MKHCTHHRRYRHAAYTSVEVLMAMTVFSIGASGVIAMQRTSIQGNYDARALDVASGIARSFQERLKRDADLWTIPGQPPSATTWLKNATSEATWVVPSYPSALASGGSPAFDLLGRDLTKPEGEGTPTMTATFCTQIRLQTFPAPVRLVRSEVRVLWSRNGSPIACIEGPGIDITAPANADRYRSLSTITLIRGGFR
jgi:Tfp pilus assembly protein PilV